jgi:integrase
VAGQLIPRGPNTWLLRVFTGRAAGKRTYHNETYRGTKKGADAKLAKLLTEHSEGRLVSRSRQTVDAYLTIWLEGIEGSVRARTHAAYTATCKTYIRPHLGAHRLTELDEVTVRGFYAKLRKKGLAPRTIRSVHEVLRNALESALEMRLIRSNPAAARIVRRVLPTLKHTPRPTVLAGDPLEAFLTAAAADEHEVYWLLLLFGGLRPEEALALQWADLEADRVHVRRVLVDAPGVPLHFENPKSDTSRRAVTLPPVVVEALTAHRARQAKARLLVGEEWQDGDLVLCNPFGQPLRQGALRRRWAKLRTAAKLPEEMRVYDLRHSMASLLLAAGESPKIVQERLGHSSVALTLQTYSHAHPDAQKGAADKLGGLVRRRSDSGA